MFVLWLNRRVPGMWLVLGGTVANVIAISANGGVMPASAGALKLAGLPTASQGFVSSNAVAGARVGFLGDIFGVPAWLPFHNVFSVGDVFIVAGAAFAVLSLGGSHLLKASLRRPSKPPTGRAQLGDPATDPRRSRAVGRD